LIYYPSLRKINERFIGYSPYSQIVFGYIDLWIDEKSVSFNKFYFFDILSLSPIENYIYKPSWAIKFGLENLHYINGERKDTDKIALLLSPKIGVTFNIFEIEHLSLFLYFLVGFDIVSHTSFKRYLNVLPNISIGVLFFPFYDLSFYYLLKINYIENDTIFVKNTIEFYWYFYKNRDIALIIFFEKNFIYELENKNFTQKEYFGRVGFMKYL
jgi:hypothetical protein